MDAELVKLSPEHERYLVERPSAHERKEQDIDGSLIELQIVSTLVRHGCSDEEVIDYFDVRNPPCYVEGGRGKSWLESLISTARNEERSFLGNESRLNNADNTHNIRVVEIQHTPSKKRSYADGQLPFWVLRRRLGAEDAGDVEDVVLLGQWYREIIDVSAGSAYTEQVSMSTARDLAGRLRERGYVETVRLPGNRQKVKLTEKGRRYAEPVFGRLPRHVPVRGPVRKVATEEPPAHVCDAASGTVDPGEATRRSPVVRRKQPSAARKRRLVVAHTRRHERINGYYRLSFRGNKIRYIQLLTPPDEWTGMPVWENLTTALDAQKLETLSWIEAEDDRDADPIRALVPPTWTPHICGFALAAELEQHERGYRVATYVDENGELLPRIGIVEQSWYNFFQRIHRLDSPLDILSIKGTGTKKKRMFEIVPVAERLPIESELNLHSFLQTLDIDYHRNRFDQLPSGWFKMSPQRKQLVWSLLGLEEAPLLPAYMPL